MSLLTGGLHHVSIRTTDLGRAKRFYTETIGFQQVLETETTVLLDAHGTVLGVWGPAQETSPEDRFDPFRVGLDHVGFGCADRAEQRQDLREWWWRRRRRR